MKNKRLYIHWMMLALTVLCLGSCKDDNNAASGSSGPIEFKEYSPTQGAVRTRIFIDGQNFGTDVSKISVTIGGREAKVISSDGSRIYCTVLPLTPGGALEVTIYGNDKEVLSKHAFETPFIYEASSAVGTLVGKTDKDNNSSMVNGTFDEAEFEAPSWMLFDKTIGGEKHLYVCEQGRAIRRINLTTEKVTTVFTNGQGMFRKLMSMTFDATCDTMFFADDQGQNNKTLTAISYAIRRENFRNVYPYIYDKTSYSCAVNPRNGDIYYTTYFDGAVVKGRCVYNPLTSIWEAKDMFNTNGNSHTYMVMHPEGRYVYVLVHNRIFKSDMVTNPLTGVQELGAVRTFAGGNGSYNDGVATNAGFNFNDEDGPNQGVFVKNKEYVEAGKDDVYDFYLADEKNQCIRIITPDAVVSTFAGRGSANVDSNKWGYIDGKLREEARFRDPCGITYDEETKIFYVSDRNNKRIRTITVE